MGIPQEAMNRNDQGPQRTQRNQMESVKKLNFPHCHTAPQLMSQQEISEAEQMPLIQFF